MGPRVPSVEVPSGTLVPGSRSERLQALLVNSYIGQPGPVASQILLMDMETGIPICSAIHNLDWLCRPVRMTLVCGLFGLVWVHSYSLGVISNQSS